MTYTYRTRGVCSRNITFDMDENHIVTNISFEGGCNGNTKGVASLAEGMKAEDIINKCQGIRCGMRATSCPDQLTEAIKAALQK